MSIPTEASGGRASGGGGVEDGRDLELRLAGLLRRRVPVVGPHVRLGAVHVSEHAAREERGPARHAAAHGHLLHRARLGTLRREVGPLAIPPPPPPAPAAGPP